MRIGNFKIEKMDVPPRDPIAIATLWPWIDANSVGTLVLKSIKKRYSAQFMAKLSTPGLFYDFTRYRPEIDIEEEIKEISIPNTTVYLARREGKQDLILIRMLEPHSHSELFVRSVLKLLINFGVRTYILIGSMYDAVPHTRPLLISGYGMGKNARETVRKNGVLPISYRGPSSIVNMVTKEAYKMGIEAMVFIVSVPHYVILEEDHEAKLRLIELLSRIVHVPLEEDDYLKVLEQKNLIGEKIEKSKEVRAVIPQLERLYEMRIKAVEKDGTLELAPETEELLWKTIGKDVGRA